MYTPKNCLDRLVKDLEEIRRDYIEEGDFEGASELWQTKLFERQYYAMRDRIAQELHFGPSVCAVIEELAGEIKKGRPNLILQKFEAYVSQTNLPDGSHLRI